MTYSHNLSYVKFSIKINDLQNWDQLIMSKQSVNLISKIVVINAIKNAANKFDGLAFGRSSPDEMIRIVDDITDGDTLHLAKICQVLNDLKTGKLGGNSNKAIDQVIRELNSMKIKAEIKS